MPVKPLTPVECEQIRQEIEYRRVNAYWAKDMERALETIRQQAATIEALRAEISRCSGSCRDVTQEPQP